ncbi:hypothetical protein DICA4_B11210 [Diutina catenulata]
MSTKCYGQVVSSLSGRFAYQMDILKYGVCRPCLRLIEYSRRTLKSLEWDPSTPRQSPHFARFLEKGFPMLRTKKIVGFQVPNTMLPLISLSTLVNDCANYFYLTQVTFDKFFWAQNPPKFPALASFRCHGVEFGCNRRVLEFPDTLKVLHISYLCPSMDNEAFNWDLLKVPHTLIHLTLRSLGLNSFPFNKFPYLESLNLADNRLRTISGIECPANLQRNEELTELDLPCATQVDAIGCPIKIARLCSSLDILKLSTNNLESMEDISGLLNIRELEITYIGRGWSHKPSAFYQTTGSKRPPSPFELSWAVPATVQDLAITSERIQVDCLMFESESALNSFKIVTMEYDDSIKLPKTVSKLDIQCGRFNASSLPTHIEYLIIDVWIDNRGLSNFESPQATPQQFFASYDTSSPSL